MPIVETPVTSGGLSFAKVTAASGINATNVKASAGQIYGLDLFSNAAYPVFVHFYNKASAPNVGVDVPVYTIVVQAGAQYGSHEFYGVPFSTGISYSITKGYADTDVAGILLGDLFGKINYM